MLNFCDFIQVYVFSTNHHLNDRISCKKMSNYLLVNFFSEGDAGKGLQGMKQVNRTSDHNCL